LVCTGQSGLEWWTRLDRDVTTGGAVLPAGTTGGRFEGRILRGCPRKLHRRLLAAETDARGTDPAGRGGRDRRDLTHPPCAHGNLTTC